MKYGQISGNKSINRMIYKCFQFISDNDVKRFVREFKVQPQDKGQIMHTFRELILGAYLSKHGFQVCYDYKIDSKTPDWCILDNDLLPQSIIELTNFNPDAKTSMDMIHQFGEKGMWTGFPPQNTKRLYDVIQKKASKYESIVRKYVLQYVVSVFGGFYAFVDQDELNDCLFDEEWKLFKDYPEISGILFFEESSGDYLFNYYDNPFAKKIMNIPNGWFRKNS